MNQVRNASAVALVSAGLLLQTTSVRAQEAASEAAVPEAADTANGERPGNRFIEEIIVTAQKREENLKDVPISIQAFSAEALDARGIDNPVDLPAVTPGMTYTQMVGFSIIYIRGIGTDAFIPSADASVATYIDGIYFPFGHGLAQSFGAVERVEILKGPQGTLFGRNSTGGAINVITKAPGREFETSLQMSYGSYDETKTRAYVNIPLGDTLAVGVSAIYNTGDLHYKPTDNSGVDSYPREIQKGGRVRVNWAPTENFDITLSGLMLEQQGVANMINTNEAPYPQYQLLGATPVKQDYRSSSNAPTYFSGHTPVWYGEAKYSTSAFDTKLLLSRQRIVTHSAYDFDGTKAPLVSFEARAFADVDTAEFQVLSNDSSWGSDWLKWIVGVYHIESSAGFDPVDLRVGEGLVPDFITPVLENFPLLDGVQTQADVKLSGVLDTNSTAGFFQSTVNFTDTVALTLGGRYQTETRKLAKSNSKVVVSDPLQIPLPLDFSGPSADSSNFSPKVSLDWHTNDQTMLYASWQKGFKSGTFNILNIYTPTQYVKPEEVTATELGVKTTLLGGNLQLNGAVFNNEIDNLQVQFISLLSGGAARFETAGSARIRGVDFDALWVIAPDALPGLVLTASGALLDAEYTDYKNGSGYKDGTGLSFGGKGGVVGGAVLPGEDFSGNRIVRTPKFSGTLGLAYTFDFENGNLEIASDVYYNSGFYYSAQNTSRAEQESYSLLNARISYLYSPWNTRVTIFGRNLADEKYTITELPTDFGNNIQLAPPATYGVRLNWDF